MRTAQVLKSSINLKNIADLLSTERISNNFMTQRRIMGLFGKKSSCKNLAE